MTINLARQNQNMLDAFQPYALDVANVTNKTWGYGGMPVNMMGTDNMGGHKHEESKEEEESSGYASHYSTRERPSRVSRTTDR